MAQAWEQMDVKTFTRKYSVDVIAGSMEKPNSVFRKKEAIEVSQAVGQFARAAPGSVTKIMLGVLQKAFTEVAIKPEDWASIDQEVNASMQKGQPTGAGQPQAAGQSGQPAGGDMMQRAASCTRRREAES